MLLRSGEWEKLLEFVQAACRLASDLPQWETSGHNTLRERCFNTLAAFCTAALQKHRPAARRARGLLRRSADTHTHTLRSSSRQSALTPLVVSVGSERLRRRGARSVRVWRSWRRSCRNIRAENHKHRSTPERRSRDTGRSTGACDPSVRPLALTGPRIPCDGQSVDRLIT